MAQVASSWSSSPVNRKVWPEIGRRRLRVCQDRMASPQKRPTAGLKCQMRGRVGQPCRNRSFPDRPSADLIFLSVTCSTTACCVAATPRRQNESQALRKTCVQGVKPARHAALRDRKLRWALAGGDRQVQPHPTENEVLHCFGVASPHNDRQARMMASGGASGRNARNTTSPTRHPKAP